MAVKITPDGVRAPSREAQAVPCGPYNRVMADILLPAVVIAFFVLATLLVKACDLLIGAPDPRPDEAERR